MTSRGFVIEVNSGMDEVGVFHFIERKNLIGRGEGGSAGRIQENHMFLVVSMIVSNRHTHTNILRITTICVYAGGYKIRHFALVF